ncbi:MAG: DNA alkylation repair protein [Saprospiraceae bacterium]
MVTYQEYSSALIDKFVKASDPHRAKQMQAYMKDNFTFFGISTPLRKEIMRSLSPPKPLLLNYDFIKTIDLLWESDERELQYCALELMQKVLKQFNVDHLDWIESLITRKSWWDSVDSIAPNIVGHIFKQESKEKSLFLEKWIASDNFWLNRTAIIFQLKYHTNTDEDILIASILAHDQSKEFFVRKAQGWALRQYSKTNPVFVRQFIEANPQLSGLTKREAMKYC